MEDLVEHQAGKCDEVQPRQGRGQSPVNARQPTEAGRSDKVALYDPAAGYAPGYPSPASYAMLQRVMVGAPVAERATGYATASLVCSLLGLCVGFSAILGVIFGHIALSQINSSNNMQQGRGLAIAGLIIGYCIIGLIAIYIVIVIAAAASNAGAVSLLSALVR